MELFESLENHLQSSLQAGNVAAGVAEATLAIATATREISNQLRRGRLPDVSGATSDNNADDIQKELNLIANNIVMAALETAPVAWIVAEGLAQPARGKPGATLIAAVSPLDGFSNIETNAAVGTIFSLLPAAGENDASPDSVLQCGTRQLAAGYVIYGPQTAMVLTLGSGTHIFTLDPETSTFRLTAANVLIAETTDEFAINISNFRHWDYAVRTYIDDCLNGEDGYRNSNYNMRWLASLVADCHRILSRGGVFLYPSDARQGYGNGRLRLLYEVNPIAFLVEQAGGAGTTGSQRLLDIEPVSVHQRVPIIFGSGREIARVERYFNQSESLGDRSQLFTKRGLFRT